jgi:hypothetical protein
VDAVGGSLLLLWLAYETFFLVLATAGRLSMRWEAVVGLWYLLFTRGSMASCSRCRSTAVVVGAKGSQVALRLQEPSYKPPHGPMLGEAVVGLWRLLSTQGSMGYCNSEDCETVLVVRGKRSSKR